MKTKALFILIKSLKILNLLIKILFSSENTRKLISGEGLVIRAGGSEIFSKKITWVRGAFIRDLRL